MSRHVLAFAITLCASSSVYAGTPRLGHSAPFAGKTLTLSIENAAPRAPIHLYFSSKAGTTNTLWGALELARDGMQLVANGTTNAGGQWSYDLPIPLDGALVETPMHFQAIVHDPAGRAGGVLSNAVHAQVIGSRMYGAYHGFGTRWGMYILSGVSESILARVVYPTPLDLGTGEIRTGKPVFDATHSSGAVLTTSRELLFFDTSTGAVLGRVNFTGDCVSELVTDVAHQYVYLLQPGTAGSAKIRRVDFATRTELAPFDLPNLTSSNWTISRTGLSVFVGEIGVSGRAQLRQIQLDPLADLGASRVGTPTTTEVGAIVYGGGHVFVWGNSPSGENITRFRETPTGLVPTFVTALPCESRLMTAVIGSDRLVGTMRGHCDYWTPPSGGAWEMPISTAGAVVSLPPAPNTYEFIVKDIEADGKLAWFVASPELFSPIVLYRLDLTTHSWTVMPGPDLAWSPNDAEPLRDPWNHELWVATQASLSPPAPPGFFTAEIRVFDELTSTVRRIPLEHSIQALHAVPMP